MAKKGIHPVYKAATITCACGNKVETYSTRGSFMVDICSPATRSTRASRSSSTRPAASSASRRSTRRQGQAAASADRAAGYAGESPRLELELRTASLLRARRASGR